VLSSGSRRANVVVDGVDLAATVGRRLQLGECTIQVIGETRPCRLMDDYAAGLQEALSAPFRGGVYGQIVTGGTVAIDSTVFLESAE
jgi:MOSC domain-containing protein YiiM